MVHVLHQEGYPVRRPAQERLQCQQGRHGVVRAADPRQGRARIGWRRWVGRDEVQQTRRDGERRRVKALSSQPGRQEVLQVARRHTRLRRVDAILRVEPEHGSGGASPQALFELTKPPLGRRHGSPPAPDARQGQRPQIIEPRATRAPAASRPFPLLRRGGEQTRHAPGQSRPTPAVVKRLLGQTQVDTLFLKGAKEHPTRLLTLRPLESGEVRLHLSLGRLQHEMDRRPVFTRSQDGRLAAVGGPGDAGPIPRLLEGAEHFPGKE